MEKAGYCVTAKNIRMKIFSILVLSLLAASAVAQQKPAKKDPPKLVKVVKSPPVVIAVDSVKKATPKKYKNKPVPRVVVQKFTPAKPKQ